MRAFSSMLLALLLTAFVSVAVAVPSLYIITARAIRAYHSATAEQIADQLRHANTAREESEVLQRLRQRYPDVAISVVPATVRVLKHDGVEIRPVGDRAVVTWFPDTLSDTRRLFRFSAMAAAVAVIATATLLVLRIVAVLSSGQAESTSEAVSATAERTYLLETFESSIRTLRDRETRLVRLHKDEKARADALASVTATLVRSLPSGFVSFDETGRILDLNSTARDLLALQAGPLPEHRRVDELADNTFCRFLAEAVDRRLALHRQVVEDADRRILIDVSTVPLTDERGRFFGMLALISDLTPMQRLETTIHEMETLAALGEMSAGIAHEFRNSLSTIIGYVRLAKKCALPVDAESRLGHAEDEARLLAEAVESLLSFARPMKLQPQAVDVMDLVTEVVARQTAQLEGITCELVGEALTIEADPALLRRALENLLRNAADAIHAKPQPSGRITVEVSGTARRLTITDDGVGVEAEMVDRLFLPFQSNKPHGFGLGLALVKKIVVLHGGSVSLTGLHGKGATATIEFGPSLPAMTPRSRHGRAVTFSPTS